MHIEALDPLISLVMSPELFWELFWYLFSGAVATVVSFVGYSVLFRRFSLGNVPSKCISWFAAATSAFLLMRWLAFSGTTTGFWESAWKTYSSRIVTAALTVAVMWWILDKMLRWDLRDKERVKRDYGWWPEIINLIVTVVETALNYFLARFWIF